MKRGVALRKLKSCSKRQLPIQTSTNQPPSFQEWPLQFRAGRHW